MRSTRSSSNARVRSRRRSSRWVTPPGWPGSRPIWCVTCARRCSCCLGGVLFVVLIAAVNIANLSLVRGSARMKELATRSAIGAGRGRIAFQLVDRGDAADGDRRSAGPARRLLEPRRARVAAALRSAACARDSDGRADVRVHAGPGAPARARRRRRAGRAACASQLEQHAARRRPVRHGRSAARDSSGADSCVPGRAGVRAAGRAQACCSRASSGCLRVDPGFVADGVLTGRVSPLETRYPDDAALRVVRQPGRSIGFARCPGSRRPARAAICPFSWDGSSSVIIPEGRSMDPGASVVSPNQLYVTPGIWRP